MNELEEGSNLDPDFGKIAEVAATGANVVPVVLQDHDSALPGASNDGRGLPHSVAIGFGTTHLLLPNDHR